MQCNINITETLLLQLPVLELLINTE